MHAVRIASILVALAASFHFPRAQGQSYTVGADSACFFTSIQAAVDAVPDVGMTDIRIASNQSYTGQHIVVQDADVALIGGYTDCSDFDPEGALTTLNGAANGGGAVIAIRGHSNVVLRNLFIRGAERGTGADGGGIDFAATGGLSIQRSTISLNTAGYGGGINFRGTGGHAYLDIQSDTLVLNNTATTSGGGIRVEGDATLHMNAPAILVAFNHALGGYGGGVQVIGPAYGNIGSPGYNGGAVIQFNDAQRGGGLSVHAGQDVDHDGYVRIFSTDPLQPVQISNNFATLTGGGVYVQPTAIFDSGGYHPLFASFCAQQFRIDDNIAQEGAAIYSDTADYNLGLDYIGGTVRLGSATDTCFGQLQPPTNGVPVACAAGIECNTLDRNITENAGGDATAGSTILMQTDGSLGIYGLRMRDNVGAHALRLFDTDADVRNALIANNTYASHLMLVEEEGDQGLVLRGTTIAGNAIGGSVLRAGNDSQIGNVVVVQPGIPLYSPIGFPQSFFEYIVASVTDGLPVRDDIVEAEATFVDAAARDYHLAPTSLGVDFAPAAGGNDLDGRPRDVDLPVTNVFGPRDIGAYETQLACAGTDTIFCDGFED